MYDYFYSGVPKEKRAGQGVAILIHRKYRKYITTWEGISERIIKINMNIRGYRLTIIGVYAVNDDSPTASKDAFFQQLNDEIIKTGKTREIFLLGDLNSRTGKSDNDVTIGKYGEETLNNNGERLIDMCKQNNLRILIGFYQHRNIHKYTSTQDTKKLRSIIDYVITKQKTKIQIQDVRVYRGAICGSDHHLLKAKIFLPYKREKIEYKEIENVTKEIEERRYNLTALEDPACKCYTEKD